MSSAATNLKEPKSLESLKEQLIRERQLGNLEEEARLCNSIAKKYESHSKFHLALKYHLCDLEISQEISDLEGVCIALGNIADAYRILKNFVSSYETQVKRIEMAKNEGFSMEQFNGYFGMGLLYSEWSCASLDTSQFVDLDHLQTSSEFFQRAMEFSLEANLEVSCFYSAKLQLARVTDDLGEKEKAESLFLDVLSASGKQVQVKIDCLELLVDFHLVHKEYDSAFNCQIELLQFAKQAKDALAECNAIFLSGKIFKAQGKYSEALECFNQYKAFAKTVVKRESLAQQANEFISECIEGVEQVKALERRAFFVQKEQTAIDLFLSLKEIAAKCFELGQLQEALQIRNQQLNLLLQLESDISTEEKHEFYLQFGELLEDCKSYREALISYRNSLRLFDQLSIQDQNRLAYNKPVLLCNIANSMDGMKEPFDPVCEIYREALILCNRNEAEYQMLGLKIQCNLYELLWSVKEYHEARKIQSTFRERFLVKEIEASEAELSEINSFSYFSNRKPSKKMKKLVGDFVMKPKKANSAGLNLKRKKRRALEPKVERPREPLMHTARTSTAVIRRAPTIVEVSSDEMDDFLVKDVESAGAKRAQDSFGGDCFPHVIDSDSGKDEVNSQSSCLLNVNYAKEKNDSFVNSTPEFQSQESIGADYPDDNLPSFNNLQLMEIHHSAPNPDLDLLNTYKSKIKLYGHFPDLKILERLKNNTGTINFRGIFLPAKDLHSFFQFISQEWNTATKSIDISFNALTNAEIDLIFAQMHFPAVETLILAANLLTCTALRTLEQTFSFQRIISLDISFMNCHSIALIVDTLSKLPLLQNLSLKSCSLYFIEDEALDSFLRTISRYKNLSLDLSYNSFSDNAFKILLKAVALKFESLKSLDLSGIVFPTLELQNLLQDFYLCHSLEKLALNACALTSLVPLQKFIEKRLGALWLEVGYNEALTVNDFHVFFSFLAKCPEKLKVLALEEGEKFNSCTLLANSFTQIIKV